MFNTCFVGDIVDSERTLGEEEVVVAINESEEPNPNLTLEILRHFLHSGISGLVHLGYDANTGRGLADVFGDYYGQHLGKLTDSDLETSARLTMALLGLKANFDAREQLHPGLDWERVRWALENNLEALEVVAKMMENGHEPDVMTLRIAGKFNRKLVDELNSKGFYIITGSVETPISTRNCVYDRVFEILISDAYPNETFDGNAVDQSEKMGLSLLSEGIYDYQLQGRGIRFDLNYRTWLLCNYNEPRYLMRSDLEGLTSYYVWEYCSPTDVDWGWRGMLWVEWAK